MCKTYNREMDVARKAYRNKRPLLMQMDDLSAKAGMDTSALKRVKRMK
jgi:hypothetical protein